MNVSIRNDQTKEAAINSSQTTETDSEKTGRRKTETGEKPDMPAMYTLHKQFIDSTARQKTQQSLGATGLVWSKGTVGIHCEEPYGKHLQSRTSSLSRRAQIATTRAQNEQMSPLAAITSPHIESRSARGPRVSPTCSRKAPYLQPRPRPKNILRYQSAILGPPPTESMVSFGK